MKIPKNVLLVMLLTLAVATTVISCKKDKTTDLIGNWLEKPDYRGDARQEAVAFAIGEMGYVGTGYNGDDRLNNFYSYNVNADRWEIVATDSLMTPRTGAVAFTAGGKGYVGTGRDNTKELKDFWEYTPETNTWKRVADCPIGRYSAVAFSINDIGYMGTGYNGSTLLDFYSYDPQTNTWKEIASYPTKVREAVAFVLGNKGYVVTGEKNGVNIDDFFMYDPGTDKWTAMRKVDDVSAESYDDDYTITRQKAVAFTIAGRAYVTTGEKGGTVKDVWEYNPDTDLWVAKTSFEGVARSNAVAFTTASGRGFVATGYNGSSTYFDDLYEFRPVDDFNADD
ncbi:MAG TPA: kelch repeat-containing protein [Bacteroidales bacterium]|nr:kelch repeat-containing protein [Bacteroidales bacterium]